MSPLSAPPASAGTADLAEELCALQRRIAARDQGALGRLYDLAADRVFGVALRVLGDRDDAEEAVGDVFHQVWERAASYSPERGSVMSWLLVIAYTRAVDIKRRVGERRRFEPLHPEEAGEAYTEREERTVTDLIDLMTSGTAIHAALGRLGEQPRRLIGMAFIEDLTHQEIAAATGMALGTVKSHIRRGLIQLRDLLAEGGVVHES